ncbi:SRPBCC domain-containing protein [Actinoplanes sp. NPDC051513]|uniref:SRPBCC domain-containing protein n=1 Tax=Actinoplanes sp. NPDC051513 TaxID=3363908 RepID=UPI0037A47E86
MSLPPLHRQIVVPASPGEAFEVFTARIGEWWPVGRFSVFGEGAVAAFHDGELVETGPDGGTAVWGKVLDWQPPRSFRMTWHPGRDAAGASVVEVSFAPVGDEATLVTVTHSGWESLDARGEYRRGWPAVLSSLAATCKPAVSEPAQNEPAQNEPAEGEPADLVLVLSHSAAPGVGNPFEHPLFGEHARFLQRLRDRGILVGAGPFAATGEGMTIVRVGGAGEAAAIVHDAQHTDGAVTGGVLEVRARPWVVMLTGVSLA